MDDRICEAGLNRSLKLIRQGRAKTVWLALDADPPVVSRVLEAAAEKGIVPNREKTGLQLAKMCNIDVYTAVAVEKIDTNHY